MLAILLGFFRLILVRRFDGSHQSRRFVGRLFSWPADQPRRQRAVSLDLRLLFTDQIDLWEPANLIFVIVGIFVPGVARFFIFKGMERLGASISSCLTNSTPLFATLFAVFFFHERPSVTNLLGTFSIVARHRLALLAWNQPKLGARGIFCFLSPPPSCSRRATIWSALACPIHAPIPSAHPSPQPPRSLPCRSLLALRRKNRLRSGPTRASILRRRWLYELSFLRLRLHRAQHGTGIDHFAVDQRLIAVRLAVSVLFLKDWNN